MQVRAAYSVHDARAVLPGAVSAAVAPDPVVTNERRMIGDGPYVLTRQVLTYWVRWMDNRSDFSRDGLRRMIGDQAVFALRQLEANLRELGDTSTWFEVYASGTFNYRLKPLIARKLAFGLTFDAKIIPQLMRAIGISDTRKTDKLEKALRAMERVETIKRTPAVTVAAAPAITGKDETEEPMALREQIAKQLEERKLDLRDPVPEQAKRDIAAVLGCHESTVNRNIVDLRAARNIGAVPAKSANSKIDRLRELIADRGIDLRKQVTTAEKAELAELLNTTSATISAYLASLRNGMLDRMTDPPKATAAAVVEVPEDRCHAWNGDPFDDDDSVRCTRERGHSGVHRNGLKTWNDNANLPAPKAPSRVKAQSDDGHKLRAEIDIMRSQLDALTVERDSLKCELSTWKVPKKAFIHWALHPECPDVSACCQLAFDENGVTCLKCLAAMAKNLRKGFRKLSDERDDLLRELEALKLQLAESQRTITALMPGDAGHPLDTPAVIPVATVPQAIASAEVREMVGYEALGADIGRLVTSKQEQYGDSFGRSGEILRVLYPDGIRPEQMDDALAVVRITDKLFRIAAGNQGGENAYADIAGYGLLGAAKGASN